MGEWFGNRCFTIDLEDGFFALPQVFHRKDPDSRRDVSQGGEVLGGSVPFSGSDDDTSGRTLGAGLTHSANGNAGSSLLFPELNDTVGTYDLPPVGEDLMTVFVNIQTGLSALRKDGSWRPTHPVEGPALTTARQAWIAAIDRATDLIETELGSLIAPQGGRENPPSSSG